MDTQAGVGGSRPALRRAARLWNLLAHVVQKSTEILLAQASETDNLSALARLFSAKEFLG